jgi:F0F1-type ATP synthase delta subunit
MSSGPVGKGMSYWATIQITNELSEPQLQEIVSKIKQAIGNNGKIVDEARTSSAGQSSFSVAFRKKSGGGQ